VGAALVKTIGSYNIHIVCCLRNLTQGLKETGKLEIKALITRNSGNYKKTTARWVMSQHGGKTNFFHRNESRHVVTSPTRADAISQVIYLFRSFVEA